MMILFFLNLMLAASAAELVKSSPPYTPVCPGDKVVLTCTTSTGLTFWRVSGPNAKIVIVPESGTVFTTLILNITKRNGKTVVSTGTYESINKSLNGTVIGCTGGSVNPEYSNVQHMSQIVSRRR